MKKQTILFLVLSSVFFISTLVLSYLLVQEKILSSQFSAFWKTCITSFMNSVDNTLCEEDAFAGNIKISGCKGFQDKVISDYQRAKSIGYSANYTYIGQ